jgi:DNA-binding NtrC family response regulator
MEGRFRADLYYRLRGLEFHSPPLRSRIEDLPVLAVEFLQRAAAEYGKRILGITNGALALLQSRQWPGNIRELQSEIRRAVLVCDNDCSLEEKHFLLVVRGPAPTVEAIPMPAPPLTLRERVEIVEREEIERALQISRGNRSHAARMLGITRNGLAHKLRRLGIEVVE